MAANISRMTVDSNAAMEQAITSYITQGFTVVNKTATNVTLIKRKQFSVLWAVIGFIVCVLPLLIYLIVYASQSDQVVEIVLVSGASSTPVVTKRSRPRPLRSTTPRAA